MTKKKKFAYSTILIIVNIFLIFINNFQVNKRSRVLNLEKGINSKIQKIELFKNMILNYSKDERTFAIFMKKIDVHLFKENDIKSFANRFKLKGFEFSSSKISKHKKINVYEGKMHFSSSFDSFNNFLSKFENSVKIVDIKRCKVERVNGSVYVDILFQYLKKEING